MYITSSAASFYFCRITAYDKSSKNEINRSSTSIKSSAYACVEDKRSVVDTEAMKPVIAMTANVRLLLPKPQFSKIPTKTHDGGSPQAANTNTDRDAFMIYSNDNVRRAVILNAAVDTNEDDNPVYQPIKRKTRISFELHQDQFLRELME